MAAHLSNENFQTCYGNIGQCGVVKISTPEEEQRVQTAQIAGCTAFGFVVRNEQGRITRIAMIHSMSEHGDLLSFRENHRDLSVIENFCELYNNTVQLDENSLQEKVDNTLYKKGDKKSYITMLAYALHGIDKTSSTVEVYCVMSSDDMHDIAAEANGCKQALETLGYTVNSSTPLQTETKKFSIDAKGNLSYSYVDEDTLQKIGEIESLIAMLQEKTSSFFENRNSIKMQFLIKLKRLYINQEGKVGGDAVEGIYAQLAQDHKTTAEKIKQKVTAGVFTHKVADFLAKESCFFAINNTR